MPQYIDKGDSSYGEDIAYKKHLESVHARNGAELRNINILQNIDSVIRTAREAGTASNINNPMDFVQQVAAKLALTGQDIKDIPKIPSAIIAGAKELISTPLKTTIKNIAENPPSISTVASMLLPTEGLAAYREVMPLAARTYIHQAMNDVLHINTPFTYATKAEKDALTKGAQLAIDDYLVERRARERKVSKSYKNLYEARLPENKDKYNLVYMKERLRSAKRELSSLDNHYPVDLEIVNNARKDYLEASGKHAPGMYVEPFTDMAGSALGKHIVEMTKDAEGTIVPKAIHDVYKFYPDVYGYGEKINGVGKPIENLLEMIRRKIDPRHSIGMETWKEIFSVSAHHPLGAELRKAAFNRKPMIVNIPLLKDSPINAYDKIVALMGLQAGVKRSSK